MPICTWNSQRQLRTLEDPLRQGWNPSLASRVLPHLPTCPTGGNARASLQEAPAYPGAGPRLLAAEPQPKQFPAPRRKREGRRWGSHTPSPAAGFSTTPETTRAAALCIHCEPLKPGQPALAGPQRWRSQPPTMPPPGPPRWRRTASTTSRGPRTRCSRCRPSSRPARRWVPGPSWDPLAPPLHGQGSASQTRIPSGSHGQSPKPFASIVPQRTPAANPGRHRFCMHKISLSRGETRSREEVFSTVWKLSLFLNLLAVLANRSSWPPNNSLNFQGNSSALTQKETVRNKPLIRGQKQCGLLPGSGHPHPALDDALPCLKLA